MILVLFTLLLLLSSCARIIVYTDPLTSEEHVNLGYIYEKQGKIELAREEYKRAIRKDRKNWIAYYNLGNIYAKEENWERAEELYLGALEIKRDPDLLNNLAYVLNKKGDHCLALKLIEEALIKAQRAEYMQTKEEIKNTIERKKVECLSFEREGELW
ncbi:tetratricopeptide repeat protein [Hydrogenobacter sp. T-2]|uniref:tetratricopeptide repeat protein n=1 Tax=Pampinifervens diazotrophicum TaxID=1632018 RepID=UPI002B25B048|nr:tetratricopeptide repeat protein [Hydrogenobacter sp. T-2]WPM32345.1 tetratricopeptide repeat protein [Hydrogenobacter sp. T-2]